MISGYVISKLLPQEVDGEMKEWNPETRKKNPSFATRESPCAKCKTKGHVQTATSFHAGFHSGIIDLALKKKQRGFDWNDITSRPRCHRKVCKVIYVGVSKNHGIPKSSILIGFSIIFTIHFGGNTPIFGNTHMERCDNLPSSVVTLSTLPPKMFRECPPHSGEGTSIFGMFLWMVDRY